MLKTNKQIKRNAGFTLIELLVVIGILAVLLAIVLIAINPAKQFAQANNTKRRADVSAILNAVGQYSADHSGTLPAGIVAVGIPPANNMQSVAGGTNICSLLVTDGHYISALPSDPKTGSYTDCSTYDLKYTISKDGNNVVTVTATAESVDGVAPVISVSR